MKRALAILLCVTLLLTLVGCGTKTKAYKGKPLSALRFDRIEYLGDITTTYIIDFKDNVIIQSDPYFSHENKDPGFHQIASFSDKEEAELIDKLFLFGLFDIDDDYPSPPGIYDGGGWVLTTEYRDGTIKKSSGSNNSPKDVFSNCAKVFYQICKDGIVGYVTEE